MSDLSTVELLEQRLKADWSHLRLARERANDTIAKLRSALKGFDSADTVIVASGSLARKEFTSGSDIDWTLLVDGSAAPEHFDLAVAIGPIVKQFAGKPSGAEGTFGGLVFSHDLVHDIGGEDDTNRNTTRRLLLLLESTPVSRDDAYTRVVRNVLKRYLREDRGFWKGTQFRVPRFLQNDFARYWRTMAVDFAYKMRKRSGEGWAIRNLKLRMSRKLIYVSGLLACYRCHLDHTPEEWSEIVATPDRQERLINYYSRVFQQTPLEIISGILLRYPHLDEAANEIVGSYNEFLGILADKERREALDDLDETMGETDVVYQQARSLSHTFRDGLLKLVFDEQSGMDELTKNYGVF
jgi:hypothetical protein